MNCPEWTVRGVSTVTYGFGSKAQANVLVSGLRHNMMRADEASGSVTRTRRAHPCQGIRRRADSDTGSHLKECWARCQRLR